MHWLLTATIALLFTVIVHSVLCRFYMQINRVIKFVLIFIPIWICLLWLLSNKYGIFSLETFAGILTYSFLCELYVFLFTMILSSISANILHQLLKVKMPITTLINMYNSKDMVQNRITRLIETGLLNEKENRYLITPKAKHLLKVFNYAKKIFKHD